jgi:RNA polymerase sigma-70 factor (ECF subfamily)
VYRVTRSPSDADDIVQDAFCRLIRADLTALTEEESRRYVFRIASNLMTDRWRRAEREASWLDRLRGEAHVVEPDIALDEGVAQEFGALKPRDRALLWLAYGSVKVLLSRARARLRKLLVTRGVTARA